ncbi:protein of unknown function [Hyphomicrobium sp. MC1]|nr:protein of unknown function [Hyphomicrobium sp. MC1]
MRRGSSGSAGDGGLIGQYPKVREKNMSGSTSGPLIQYVPDIGFKAMMSFGKDQVGSSDEQSAMPYRFCSAAQRFRASPF